MGVFRDLGLFAARDMDKLLSCLLRKYSARKLSSFWFRSECGAWLNGDFGLHRTSMLLTMQSNPHSLEHQKQQHEASVSTCWNDLLDDVLLDICQQEHRRAKIGGGAWGTPHDGVEGARTYEAQSIADPGEPASRVPPVSSSSRAGMLDIFGQSHPAKAVDIVTCKNCSR